LPLLAELRIDTQTCLPYSGPECGACAHACPVPGALIWNMCKPYIVPQLCVGCSLCREACIVDTKAILVRSRFKAAAVKPPAAEGGGDA
jgi:ferredoxin-type protein NapG